MQPFENFQKHFFFKHSNLRKVNCVAYFVVLRREPIKWAHCNIIKNLKSIFARHGIPKILITDNRTQFNSSEIEKFANNWNFSIIPAAPKHQQCNGMVERTIQTIKR
jgi:hypothetical protein